MNYEIENTNSLICSNIENENNFYVFEIKIITSDNINIYRKISYNKEGLLLELKNNIKKIKITMCRINNLNNIITLRKRFTDIINNTIILYNDNLVITLINNEDDNININYNII